MSDLRQRLLANTQANRERLKEMGERTVTVVPTPSLPVAAPPTRYRPTPPAHADASAPAETAQQPPDTAVPEQDPSPAAPAIDEERTDATAAGKPEQDDDQPVRGLTSEEADDLVEAMEDVYDLDEETVAEAKRRTAVVTDTLGRNRSLTPSQEKFCELRASGKRQIEAYEGAYDTSQMTRKTASEAASRLEAKAHIRARIEALKGALKARIYDDAKAQRLQIFDTIFDIMRNGQKDADRLKATHMLGSMNHLKLWEVDKNAKDDDLSELSDAEMKARISKLLKPDG